MPIGPAVMESTRQAVLRVEGLAEALRAVQAVASAPADKAALGFAARYAFEAAAKLRKGLNRLEGRERAEKRIRP